MKPRSIATLVVLIVALSPMAYLAIIYSSLPDMVPVHYDLNFKPDRMGSKDNTWLLTGILSGVSLLVYLLLSNLRKFDPKQRNLPPSASFLRIAIVVTVFVTLLNFLILIAIKDNILVMKKLLFPLLGLMMAFLGNYMNTLKPNYFAGFRLPWTLSSDYNWKKTHLFASKLWFWGGLFIAVACLFVPQPSIIFMISMAVLVIIPITYSYRTYKQEVKN